MKQKKLLVLNFLFLNLKYIYLLYYMTDAETIDILFLLIGLLYICGYIKFISVFS